MDAPDPERKSQGDTRLLHRSSETALISRPAPEWEEQRAQHQGTKLLGLRPQARKLVAL